jgi:hypothetical protein
MVAVMILARFVPPAAIALALLFALAAPKTSPEEIDRVDGRFEIYGFAGFHVLTNRTTVREIGNRYAITMDLDTRGLASVFVNLTSHSEVHGELSGSATHPEAYRADVRRNGVERHYGLDYRRDGSVIINASAPAAAGRPFLLAAEQLRGTVDQLTAYFVLERQLARGGNCSLVLPVFDGAGFYNLRFTDLKQEKLSADGYQNFAGPARACEVTREDIVVNPDRNEDTYKHGRIWYAQVVAGDRMMPVRMEFDTAFGAVRGYLAELHGRGSALNLMKE